MANHRTHSSEFKRQRAQEYPGGETLHGLSKRHDLSRNLIQIWVEKYQAGGLGEDSVAADLLQSYEAGAPRSSGWSASRLLNSTF